MIDGSSMAGKRFRAARSLSTDEPSRPTGEPTRLLYGYLKPKNTLRAAQFPGAPPLRIGTPTRWTIDGSSTAGKRFRAARSLSTDEPARPTGEPTRLLYGYLKPKKRPPRGTISGRAAPPNRHADALDDRWKLDGGKTLPRGAAFEYARAGNPHRKLDADSTVAAPLYP